MFMVTPASQLILQKKQVSYETIAKTISDRTAITKSMSAVRHVTFPLRELLMDPVPPLM